MKTKRDTLMIIGSGFPGRNVLMMAKTTKPAPMKITMSVTGSEAELRITGIIGDWRNTAEDVYAQLLSLKEKGVTKLKAYINSPGGSAFDGNEMYNVVQAFDGEKEITIGALCASAATIFALAFPVRIGHANSHGMIHRPTTRVEGNEDQLESDLVLLRGLQNDFVALYAAAFKKKPEEITALWKNDFWFNSQVGLQLGFFTKLINGSDTSDPETLAYIPKMGYKNLPVALIQMAAQAEEEINQPPKNKNMEHEELCAALGLPKTATAEEVKAKIAANKKASDDAIQAASTEAETKAEALAESGVVAKKYAPGMKANYKTFALANYDAAKAAIDALPVVVKISKEINGGGKGLPDVTDRSAWDWEKYQKEDPKALLAMKDKNSENYNPETFKALFKAKYGKELTEQI